MDHIFNQELRVAAITLCVCLAGCSSSSEMTASDGDGEAVMMTFNDIIKTVPDKTNPEIWSCLSDRGYILGYTFYEPNAIAGVDHPVGRAVLASDPLNPFTYIWTVTEDFSTMYLTSLATGTRDVWNNLIFNGRGLLQADSVSVGRLTCSKENGKHRI